MFNLLINLAPREEPGTTRLDDNVGPHVKIGDRQPTPMHPPRHV